MGSHVLVVPLHIGCSSLTWSWRTCGIGGHGGHCEHGGHGGLGGFKVTHLMCVIIPMALYYKICLYGLVPPYLQLFSNLTKYG